MSKVVVYSKYYAIIEIITDKALYEKFAYSVGGSNP